ncbi:MAG: VTT domain-containing protein [Actinomycetaceae bacterium]|nr:VTT domain-containing protein [Actinomycetaceae bacterium]
MLDALRELYAPLGRIITTGPFPVVFLILILTVAFRSSLVFWLGRYGGRLLVAGRESAAGFRRRMWLWSRAEGTTRAMESIRRRGWPVISLAYLTVGVQTLVNLGAGVIRMTWPRFCLAALPGWLAWALIYSTVGFAAWRAWAAAAAGSPAGIAALVCFAGAIIGYILCLRRRTGRTVPPMAADDEAATPAKES